MQSILSDLSPQSLAMANETNINEYALASRNWKRNTMFDESEMLITVTDLPVPLFNGVRRVNLPPDRVHASIERVVGLFKERGVPGNFYVGPSTRPTAIADSLLSFGFTHTDSIPCMGMDLDTLQDFPLPPDFDIEPIRTETQVKACVEVGVQGFGMPDFLKDIFMDFFLSLGIGTDSATQSYLGILNQKPVAVSTVFYGAGVAGIYNVTTLPEARGKGIGAAMTVSPLMDARAKGYKVGVLQASEMGYSIYERIGFQEVCKLEVYTWRPG